MRGQTSAQRKFIRGLEQVASICREVKDFERANAYGLTTERKVKSSGEIEYSCFAVERKAPPDHWPLSLGEAIHNLRAGLDHAVWAATEPLLRDHRTAFPVVTKASKFEGQSDRIRGLPAELRMLVEEAQPFNTAPTCPKHAPLAFLAHLSNTDKHKELTAVAVKVDAPGFSWDGPDSDMKFTDTGEGRDLHDGTKVMAFTVAGPRADQVNVGPMFGYEVRVEGIPLSGSLRRIAHEVWKCVTECETGQRFPMWTPALFVLLPDETVFADPLFPRVALTRSLEPPRLLGPRLDV